MGEEAESPFEKTVMKWDPQERARVLLGQGGG